MVTKNQSFTQSLITPMIWFDLNPPTQEQNDEGLWKIFYQKRRRVSKKMAQNQTRRLLCLHRVLPNLRQWILWEISIHPALSSWIKLSSFFWQQLLAQQDLQAKINSNLIKRLCHLLFEIIGETYHSQCNMNNCSIGWQKWNSESTMSMTLSEKKSSQAPRVSN